MAKYLPVCGRNNNQAKPIEATATGELKTIHVWESTVKDICYSQQIRDTSAHNYPADGVNRVDISEYAITSFRIVNGLDQPVTIRFYTDASAPTSLGTWLADKNGNAYAITIPTGTNQIIITPDDFPVLNYLRGIRVRVNCDTAPTSGTFAMYAICRR